MGLTGSIVRGIRSAYPFASSRPQTAGPLSWTVNASYGSLALSGGLYSSYADIYLNQPWVAICVNKIARGIMRQPLWAYQREGAGEERSRLRSGIAAETMSRPNPWQSPADYKQAVAGNLGIYGNAIAVKSGYIGADGPATELWPSPWPMWTVERGSREPVDRYVWHGSNGEVIPFRPDEVIHWKWWGPGTDGDIVGISPMEPLRQILLAEDATYRMIVAEMNNGLRPGGAFTTDQTFDLTKEPQRLAYERLRDDLTSTYGGVDNAYKFMLLHGGLKWEPMSQSFVDAEVVNLHKLSREVVVAAYDIPSPVVGIVDEANFASIDMYHTMFYQDTLGPWNELIEQGHNVQWLNHPSFAGQFVEFDQNDVLKGDIKSRFEAYRLATWMTDNEKRARENLAAIDDPLADAIYKPLSEQPIGSDLPELVPAPLPEPSRNGNGR